jgi:hypothetical protein
MMITPIKKKRCYTLRLLPTSVALPVPGKVHALAALTPERLSGGIAKLSVPEYPLALTKGEAIMAAALGLSILNCWRSDGMELFLNIAQINWVEDPRPAPAGSTHGSSIVKVFVGPTALDIQVNHPGQIITRQAAGWFATQLIPLAPVEGIHSIP